MYFYQFFGHNTWIIEKNEWFDTFISNIFRLSTGTITENSKQCS